MNQKKLDEILAKHKKWLYDENDGERANLRSSDLRSSDLSGSDLRSSDLSGSNLSGSNLSGSNIDFSCWPLWYGSKNVKVDLRIVYQLLAHVACLDCAEKEFVKIKKVIMPYAKKSHRAKDLGIL